MATSTSRLSYQDCYDILDKAIANEKGIRFPVSDYGYGNHLRVRLHYSRTLDRQENRITYPPEHKLHGRSIYDPIVVRLKQEGERWFMYLERHDIDSFDIQPLGEENVLDETTNGNLREIGGTGDGQPREEASEATHDVFAGEEEREAEPAKPIEEAGAAPVQARRRL